MDSLCGNRASTPEGVPWDAGTTLNAYLETEIGNDVLHIDPIGVADSLEATVAEEKGAGRFETGPSGSKDTLRVNRT